jgi:hypothetical protein
VNWNINIEFRWGKQEIRLNLTSDENSLLSLLRGLYGQVEAMAKSVALDKGKGELTRAMLDDVMALIHALVFNKLEPYRGEHLQIARVGK